MDLKELRKPLSISDIDFRIQSINKGGYATILAYKDARVDMNRLDDICGTENWQRDHKEVKGVVYCGIGINVDKNGGYHFAWKWDAGSESKAEGEKGQASDSFKRAGFNWGIGRELYDYPVISIKLNADPEKPKNGEWYMDGNYPKQGWGLKLKEWKWYIEFEGSEVSFLGCRDQNGTLRFSYGSVRKENNK